MSNANDDPPPRRTPFDAVPPLCPSTVAYVVRITYAEPGYAAARGIAEREYEGHFRVDASTQDEACALGMEEFRAAERTSGVSWERHVLRVTCSVLSECTSGRT